MIIAKQVEHNLYKKAFSVLVNSNMACNLLQKSASNRVKSNFYKCINPTNHLIAHNNVRFEIYLFVVG